MKVVRCVLASLSIGGAASAQLLGIHWNSGDLYSISTTNAAATLIGSTGVSQFADIEFGPNGTLYALRIGGGLPMELWTIDPTTAAASLIGPLGFNGIEGDLAFTASGVLYAAQTTSSQVMTVDTTTAAATVAFWFTTNHDLNGLATRSDGKIVALDRAPNALIVIDPSNGAIVQSFSVSPALGAVSALTNHAGQTYFTTGGPPSGSNELWRVHPFTGQHALVGSFNGVITGYGFSGLAGDTSCAAPTTYCTAGTSTNGCAPAMSATGTPSVAASSGFTLSCTALEGQRSAIVFFGASGAQASPWAIGSPSFLCVRAPVQRTVTQSTGGSLGTCDGQIALDFLAYMAVHPGALGQPLTPGQEFRAQAWYRDPPAPKSTNLSDGLRFTICP
jgi:hypothetical protein